MTDSTYWIVIVRLTHGVVRFANSDGTTTDREENATRFPAERPALAVAERVLRRNPGFVADAWPARRGD